MPLNLGVLQYRIGADTAELDQAERRVSRFVTGTDQKFNGLEKTAKRLGGFLAGIVTVAGAKKVLELADNYQVLQQRIKTATAATGDFNGVSREIARISNATGTALQTNVQLFQALARAAPELGANNQEILRLTELVGQLGVIGGSTGEQMKNGLLQFTQGLAGGVFRAEEFNSLLENTPEIANRIAQGLGMSAGELRRAVVEGKVLSQDVFQSLMGQSEKINAEFSAMPVSMGRATTALGASFQSLIGQIDTALGGTGSIAATIQRAADFLRGDFTAQIVSALRLVDQVGFVIKSWSSSINAAVTSANGLNTSWASIGATSYNAISATLNFLTEVPARLQVVWAMFQTNVHAGMQNVSAGAALIGNAFQTAFTSVRNAGETAADFVAGKWASALNAVIAFFQKSLNQVLSGITSITKVIGIGTAQVQALQAQVNALGAGAAANEAATNAAIAEREKLRAAELKTLQDQQDSILQANAAALEGIQNERVARIAAIDAEMEAQRLANEQKLSMRAAEREQAQRDAQAGAVSGFAPGGAEGVTGAAGAIGGAGSGYAAKEQAQAEHHEKTLQAERVYADEMKAISSSLSLFGLRVKQSAFDAELSATGQHFRTSLGMAAQHSKAAFALVKGLSIAQATIDGFAAVVSSYKFGASIGGPPLGAAFAAAAGAATGAQIASIAKTQFNGARERGGDVFAGGMYRVNERGPEMLSVGGKDFLMMGSQGGRVTPNDKLSGGAGGGANITVNVHTLPGQTARVESRETSVGTTLEIIVEKIEATISNSIIKGGTMISNALEGQYGLNRAGGLL